MNRNNCAVPDESRRARLETVMFDMLDRAVTARKAILRQQSENVLRRAKARAERKDEVGDNLEAARSAYRINPSDTTELALHRALLQSKYA